MIDLKYSNAFTEVLEILKYISKEDYEKVPLEMIEIMEDNCSKDYFVEYNPDISLTDQNISEEAQTIIAILFRDYWATPYQKERIEAKEKYDLEKLEEEKREKYNTDNIFKNKQEGTTNIKSSHMLLNSIVGMTILGIGALGGYIFNKIDQKKTTKLGDFAYKMFNGPNSLKKN